MTISKIHLTLVASALLIGCDSSALQDEYARQASLPPASYTATTAQGEVTNEDPDDWRTAPLYAGKVRVDQPAYPNPTTGESVYLTVSILYSDVVQGGLYLQARRANGALIDLDAVRENGPGTYLLSFSPATLGRSGLVRLFLFDSVNEIVSYGDVLIN